MSRLTLRLLLGIWLVGYVLAANTLAELEVIEDAEGHQGLTVYKLTVTPAAEPIPALKHRLSLRPNELKPGNAPIHYVRVNAENYLSGIERKIRDRHGDAFYDWIEHDRMSLSALPLDEVREVDGWLAPIVEEFLEPGTRCRESDWGLSIEDLSGLEYISFLLPEFQGTRQLGRILMLRTRLRIADHEYDDGIEHLRMSYRLAQDVGNEKILVCNLVGMAIERMANMEVIEFASAPGSPNLYWALAELPSPVVSIRDAIRLEMGGGGRFFPALQNPEQAQHSAEHWTDLLVETLNIFQTVMGTSETMRFLGPNPANPQSLPHRLTVAGLSLVGYPAAKQRLLNRGYSPEEIKAMPVGKVICVDAAWEYKLVSDSLEKWAYLPYGQVRSQMHEAEQASLQSIEGVNLGKTLAHALLPAALAAKNAEAKMPWQRGALMTIEALRMHAAETGKLPNALREITVVPVPLNPQTLQPYQYRLDGETAILELPFSDGIRGESWRFEIQLATE